VPHLEQTKRLSTGPSAGLWRMALAALILAISLIIGVGVSSLFATAAHADDYDYPAIDPWIATVIGTPRDLQPDLPKARTGKTYTVDVVGAVEPPAHFWYLDGLPFSLAAQEGPAPLVFVIAGTGVGHDAAQMQTLEANLFGRGFHVVSLPSPTHATFIATASTSGTPGLPADDARDLYRAMVAIRHLVAAKVDITSFALTGYSLGALHAAFVAELDTRNGEFDFQRTLLLNPPVNLYRSALLFDRIFAERFPNGAGDVTRFLDEATASIAVDQQRERADVISDDFLYEAYRRRDLTVDLAVGATALVFRVAAMSMTFTADVAAHTGLVVDADDNLGAFDSTTEFLEATATLGFGDYMTRVLLPRVQRSQPNADLNSLAEIAGLRSIEPWLRDNPRVALMTNHDDFILNDEDFAWLVDVFGENARVWPRGGHLGNLNHRDHVASIGDFLSGAALPEVRGALPTTAPRPPLPVPATATSPTDAPSVTSLIVNAPDPLERLNRRVYGINHLADRYVLVPVIRYYKKFIPSLARRGIHNFFANLAHVGDIGNNLLQLEARDTAISAWRFAINSTVGVGGLWDAAQHVGLYRQPEDFGQTLGLAGVAAGPYVILPLLGPSTVRDTVGRVVDTLTLNWANVYDVPQTMNDQAWPYGVQGVDERYSIPFRYYQTGSPFEYEAVRTVVLQVREFEIRN
jgi:ABC-type transporter lipoprotein component MlaA